MMRGVPRMAERRAAVSGTLNTAGSRSPPFEIVAEAPHLVGERFIAGGAGKEASDPAAEVRRDAGLGQLGLEQELGELLERG